MMMMMMMMKSCGKTTGPSGVQWYDHLRKVQDAEVRKRHSITIYMFQYKCLQGTQNTSPRNTKVMQNTFDSIGTVVINFDQKCFCLCSVCYSCSLSQEPHVPAHHTNTGAIGSRRTCFNTTPRSQVYIFAEVYCTVLTKYYSGNQIEKNDMGEACGMYGRKKRCIKGFGGKTT